MDDKKIIYYLGAGASAGDFYSKKEEINNSNLIIQDNKKYYMRSSGIPVVKRFGEEYNFFCNWVENYIPESKLNLVGIHLRKSIIELKNQLINHNSFDVLAKKYFLDNRRIELNRLKFCVSLFLSWIESYVHVDRRYDELLVTYIDPNTKSFKKNFHIISWNYDLQLERAFSSIFRGINLNNIKYYLNVTDLRRGNSAYEATGKGFTIKLNGDYSTYQKTNGENSVLEIIVPFDDHVLHDSLHNRDQYKFVDTFINLIDKFHEGYIPQIEFAWEVKRNINQEISNLLMEVEIVVIIGYSFPYVNREIDRLIFSKINPNAIVYIQDLKGNLDELEVKFKKSMSWPGKVIPIGFVDQFFIPLEL